MRFLDCIQIRRLFEDSIAWAFNTNGVFTVSSFRRKLENSAAVSELVPKCLWRGICPPKLEMFVWQLWKRKVLVKDVLQRFGMDQFEDMNCPVCSRDRETIDHIFLHCGWATELWQLCVTWWDVHFCVNSTINE